MASLDIESLLKEIADDAPCGDNLEYDQAFIAVEDEAKGTPEKQIGDRVEPAQPPNWKLLFKQLLELLQRTRDLRLLMELTRASLQLEGLRGLSEGLLLIRQSMELYWDSIHPQLDPDDDNDPTLRINTLMVLCDRDAFLLPLLNAPLVDSRAVGRFSLRDVQHATGRAQPPAGETPPQLSMIQAAFSGSEPEDVQATMDCLQGSLADLDAIESFVTDQVGVSQAPSFDPIRDLLKEASSFVGEQAGRLGLGAAVELASEPAAESGTATGGGAVAAGSRVSAGQITEVASRQDVIRLLDLICEYYARYEPSSPVPLLAKRAKRLVNMDFMELLQELAPSGVGEMEKIRGQNQATGQDQVSGREEQAPSGGW